MISNAVLDCNGLKLLGVSYSMGQTRILKRIVSIFDQNIKVAAVAVVVAVVVVVVVAAVVRFMPSNPQ